MNIRFNRRIPGATVSSLLGLLLLAGCGGGGGSSTGGGGGVNPGATSTMILHVASINGKVAAYSPQEQLQGADKMIAALRDMMVQNAWAATAGVNVYVDGVLVGTTDASGQVMFPITGGNHEICLEDPATIDATTGLPVKACTNYFVTEDTIITLNNVTVADGEVTYDPPVVGDGSEDGGPKVEICHKDRNTISVGAPAVPAHIAHGDHEGSCETEHAENEQENETEKEHGNGNNKDKKDDGNENETETSKS